MYDSPGIQGLRLFHKQMFNCLIMIYVYFVFINIEILDDLTLQNSKTVNTLDLTTYCPSEILKQYYQGQLSLWLAHRPVLKGTNE